MIASYGQNTVKPSQALGTPFFYVLSEIKIAKGCKK